MTRYGVPSRLAYVIPDDIDAPQVFLMQLPDGPPVVLHDISAVIWVLAADGESDVVAAVLDVVDVDREGVEAAVQTYLDELVDRGLLECVSD